MHHAPDFYMEDAMGPLRCRLAPCHCAADAARGRGSMDERQIITGRSVTSMVAPEPDRAADSKRRSCRLRADSLDDSGLDLAESYGHRPEH